MSDVNIDWKGKALAAEAETLNLKNLCAHHGICTVCGEYYSHHYTEPFATCKCNTSEWYEITEHMKLQDELRKLREKKPVAWRLWWAQERERQLLQNLSLSQAAEIQRHLNKLIEVTK